MDSRMEQIKKIVLTGCLATLSILAFSQEGDSVKTEVLKEIEVRSDRVIDLSRLSKVSGTYIWAGTKNEVVHVQNMDVNVAEKTPRQVFSRVPGIFVYDMDGSGNQTNISTRGLDPHRGWEYNIRKNGVITNSDMYGYPASHYSMPMEAVERIELVRGTGSLQYGAQFGGMLNYVSKGPDTTRAFTFEGITSVGSFDMVSAYFAAGGTVGKCSYYAYYNKRSSDGFRKSAHTDFDAQGLVLIYTPSRKVNLKLELARSNYLYRIPGPLNDSMFYADPRQSTRERNYFNPEIYVPSVTLNWSLSRHTKLMWTTSAVLGERNSVQFDKNALVVDAINPATGTYANRQVDIDNFNSYTSELRVLHNYRVMQFNNVLSAGVQMFNNDLHRRQLGVGTTGTDFDLSLAVPGWGRDLHLKTKNIALFAQNSFELLPGLMITPGMRMEFGGSDMTGTISYYDGSEIPTRIEHNFPLFGASADYTLRNGTNVYAGWSQAYRPVVFKDIIPASVYESADKDLQDADGYNLEAGYRGSRNGLKWDISAFRIQYNDRMGTLYNGEDASGNPLLLRTNIGNSVTQGLELFMEYGTSIGRDATLRVFTSSAFFDSEYQDAELRVGNENQNIDGNQVESVPHVISRNGVTFQIKEVSLSVLYSYTAKTYADALNTETPSKNGALGLVPAYGIWDINASARIADNWVVRLNVNNLLNEMYFTKRPSMYPGPGVWSSDGRSLNVTVGFKM